MSLIFNRLSKMEEKYRSLEELLENNKNLMSQREKEVSVLKEQVIISASLILEGGGITPTTIQDLYFFPFQFFNK